MSVPEFRIVQDEKGEGVTYTCGCSCTPTARSLPGDEPGMEHCCCGKVHFVGSNAATALATYLADRKGRRANEPAYELGVTAVALAKGTVEVAWAFPRE